ncbi:unnamed protein product [Durusdinium trenchii]|uniref:Uncharacterized protein n=2 Tax=Durusdinium trenchii TaxID=1381693 RepID=A0ABP0SC21_9DINO
MAFLLLCLAVSCAAIKKDHISGGSNADQEDSTDSLRFQSPLPASHWSTEASLPDISLMQVSLEIGPFPRDETGHQKKSQKGAGGVAMDVTKARSGPVEKGLDAAWPSNMTAEDTVRQAVAEASSAAQIAKDYATAFSRSLKDASWPTRLVTGSSKDQKLTHEEAPSHKVHRPVVRTAGHEKAESLDSVSRFIKEYLCTRSALLRLATLICGCLAVHLLLRWLHFAQTTAATASWKQVKARARGKKFDAGQEYEPSKQAGPNLYEPSLFHEDRDKRRVNMGGE